MKGRKFGRFHLGEVLGTGAMGSVYAARDQDGSSVAVKILHRELSRHLDVVERFRREAANAARVQSAFVARPLDFGDHGGQLWIAYEHLIGETLEERFARERALAVEQAAPMVDQVLQGLGDAHAVGVVHRDIKPSNIFLERTADRSTIAVRLLDFGISKFRALKDGGTSIPALTSVAETLGTVLYMPPEQFGGAANADGRADLYAAGIVAFRALTGAVSFGGRSETVMLHAKLCVPPRTLEEVTGVRWPKAAEAFFPRALAAEPGDRFADVSAMRAAWQRVVARAALPDRATFHSEVVARHAVDPAGEVNLGGSTIQATERS